jgi:uncharacterized repeat protein (TIGR02543 family)
MGVSPSGDGTATDETGTSPYAAGAQVSIQAAAKSGYQFVNWTVSPASGSIASATSATTTFTMPANAVTVTANFKSNGTTTTTSTAPTGIVVVNGDDVAPTVSISAPINFSLDTGNGPNATPMMVAGWNTVASPNAGAVTLVQGSSEKAVYTVTAQSGSPYMNNGSTNLQNYLLIGQSTSGPWYIANGGSGAVQGTNYSGILTYTGTLTGSLPFAADQYVTPTDAQGNYTATIVFTASVVP